MRSTIFSAWGSPAPYIVSSDSGASSTPSSGALMSSPAMGRMRATTTAAAARRGEMALAISKGVVPCGTSRTLPSGSWTLMVSGMMPGAEVLETTASELMRFDPVSEKAFYQHSGFRYAVPTDDNKECSPPEGGRK